MSKYIKYNMHTGVLRKKTVNMKKYVVGAIAAGLMAAGMAVPAFAATSVSGNASPEACFGQARGYYAQGGPNGVLAPLSNGSYISDRAGTNPANNAAYIAQYCAE